MSPKPSDTTQEPQQDNQSETNRLQDEASQDGHLVQADTQINYSDSLSYWDSVEPSVDGMLGGYGDQTVVPQRDIAGSQTFLRKLASRIKPGKNELKYGFELGAGIGRVSKHLLARHCDKIDLLEPSQHFVDQMQTELRPLFDAGKIGDVFHAGMQEFETLWRDDRRYWLVWCQWCLNYLPDAALVRFLTVMRGTLSEHGTIIVKENICSALYDEDIFDEVDSSVTRTDEKFKLIFKQSGLKLIAQEVQKGLPKELYPVKMYALKPDPNFA